MNKSLYRVVFNRARGIRMVVQETAASDEKVGNKTTDELATRVSVLTRRIGAASVNEKRAELDENF
ncbi:hypothetical protein J2W23_003796 [Variovorax boronicumulans]|uniref:ESPR-type extended signal peptide-containing protein n=1 Tax=Variovorax boronicumulans TaxID=436515 RepID=UPI00278B2067|nr:ESPR-type extended signal peptide-containing protein [Variovorax boronicumulans]MDQ0015396.1 hypothetical protein [Variovorax boronicumulans]